MADNTSADHKIPARLSRFVRQAEAANLITEEAYQAMLNMLDPFPDTALRPAGWPGATGSQTLKSVVNQAIALGAPAGTTLSWNFHAAFLPYMPPAGNSVNYTYNLSTGALTASSIIVGTQGTFCVWTWKDADPVPTFYNTAPAFTINLLNYVPAGTIPRLNACGIETVNTSALIDRGGYGYCYRLPGTSGKFQFDHSVLPTDNLVQETVFQGPPSAIDQIVMMHTTYSGTAESGLVSTGMPLTAENPFPIFIPGNVAFVDRVAGRAVISPLTAYPTFDWPVFGQWVTGLKPGATFQLKFNAYLESLPLTGAQVFQSLATPAVAYSPLVMEMCMAAARNMPAGFDYRENPFGEWMSRVLDCVSHILPTIGGFIPIPGAQIVANGLSKVAKYGSKQLASSSSTPSQLPKKMSATAKKTNSKGVSNPPVPPKPKNLKGKKKST